VSSMNRIRMAPRCYPFSGSVTLPRTTTASPVKWAFTGGGEGTRTLGLYIAKVWLSAF
jgi:hypothetical protein